MPITKKGQSYGDVIEITDSRGGSGQLRVVGVGPGRYVQDPIPPGSPSWYYQRGHTEYDEWRVLGKAVPDEYEMSFGLKLYEDGTILPASVDGATRFKSKGEAEGLAARWLTAGGPGLALEDPEDTKRRQKALRSAMVLQKIARQLTSLTDEDLQKLSDSALRTVARRAENAEKEAAKAEAKRLKAEEKRRKAEEKEAKKKERAEAKAAREAEQARKKAEREAKKAEREAKKSAKSAPVAPPA